VKKLLLVAILFVSVFCSAEEITVAAAADLQFAFQDVAARFQKDTGHTVKMVFGSSGNFFAQIQNGAPFDVYFSADIDYPKRLEAAGLAEPSTLYQYATGKIVLWAPANSTVDVSKGLTALLNPAVTKIAVANPEHAPYGRAAIAAMKTERIYDQVSSKLVYGENISQTASLVVSGGADTAIVALSLVVAPSMKSKGTYFEIPVDEYPAIDQAAIILKSSQNKEVARQFITYVKTPDIQSVMRGYGFTLPAAASK
jgi:molybdate transport system substrate-binding protein